MTRKVVKKRGGVKASPKAKRSSKAKPRSRVKAKVERVIKAEPPTRAARSVQRMLERLESSFDVARQRMTDVAVVADAIGASAIDARLNVMARAAVVDNLARDLVLARSRLGSGGLIDPIEFQSLLLLIDAMLAWLREHVGLEPELSAGQVLDLRASSLGRFDMEAPTRPSSGDVIRIRIDQPGWRRAGTRLAKPRATLVE